MPSLDNVDDDFKQALMAAERSLQALKTRYAQVQRDQLRQRQLLAQQQRLERSPEPASKTELKQLQRQLDELEVALESQLFSWRSLREPFWMAVRFGGLGVVLGWVLKSCAG